MLLGVITDAVIYPRAVMVHSGDAVLADRTVMRMWRLDRITLFAFLRHDLIQEPDVASVDNNSTLVYA
jgi:hypothetical protein